MKKRDYFSLIIILILCLLVLANCGGSGDDDTVRENLVLLMPFTDEQQELASLMGASGLEMWSFEFNSTESLSSITFRLEVYEYGELIETHFGVGPIDLEGPVNGIIGLNITQTRAYGAIGFEGTLNWGFSYQGTYGGNDFRLSHHRATTTIGAGINGSSLPIFMEHDITYGGDVVLYALHYVSDGNPRGMWLQDYLNPNKMADSPLVKIFIVNFAH